MNPIQVPDQGGPGKSFRQERKEVRALQQRLWDLREGIPGTGELLFTREETAAVLRTSPETVDKVVAEGRLDAIVLVDDEPALFRPEAILAFLDSSSLSARKAQAEWPGHMNRLEQDRQQKEGDS